MFSKLKIMAVTIVLSTIAAIAFYGTVIPNYSTVFAQGTIDTAHSNVTSDIDYAKFHANIEEIKGHIEKAEMNKLSGNDTLALGHTLHPIEEVLSLVTIPLSDTDSMLNVTYSERLHKLSEAAPNHNISNEEFANQSQSLIDLSNQVITTVIPNDILKNSNHNITVIQGLLTTSEGEYGEGVRDGKIVKILEYQDGSAFMERASDLFNSTKSITTDRDTISKLFGNLTTTVKHLGNASSVETIIDEINRDLSDSSTIGSNDAVSSQDYVLKIRSLLDQVLSAYSSNDSTKAKELATTAYLENFEHLEKPIGKDLADQGEQILRINLREQIDNKSSLDEIKLTVGSANQLLDKVETIIKQ